MSSSEHERYVPSLDQWGMWQMMNTGLYYPARVLEIDTEARTATLQWLDMHYVKLAAIDLNSAMPTFTQSFELCYDVIVCWDSLPELTLSQLIPLFWPWALDQDHLDENIDVNDLTFLEANTLQLSTQHDQLYHHLHSHLPHIQSILTGSSRGFIDLMEEWQQDCKNRSRKGSTFFLSFAFFQCHASLLDQIDIYIIECSLAKEIDSDELAFGPGPAMLAYFCNWVLPWDISRVGTPRSAYESAWDAMRHRVMVGVLDACKFERSHRIPNLDIALQPLQILPGPVFEAVPAVSGSVNGSMITSPLNITPIATPLDPSVPLHSWPPPSTPTTSAATTADTCPSIPKVRIHRTEQGWRAQVQTPSVLTSRAASLDAQTGLRESPTTKNCTHPQPMPPNPEVPEALNSNVKCSESKPQDIPGLGVPCAPVGVTLNSNLPAAVSVPQKRTQK
ncbi:hypothetical protein K439DRAFT_1616876 [Ramaria rubella]|nr:hypothetical protein K439DRAFT_1616876 [Ramaria rubella]